jgi:hypothetical protein
MTVEKIITYAVFSTTKKWGRFGIRWERFGKKCGGFGSGGVFTCYREIHPKRYSTRKLYYIVFIPLGNSTT